MNWICTNQMSLPVLTAVVAMSLATNSTFGVDIPGQSGLREIATQTTLAAVGEMPVQPAAVRPPAMGRMAQASVQRLREVKTVLASTALSGCPVEVIYSNLLTPTGFGFSHGETFAADDLVLKGGGDVVQVTFSVIHFSEGGVLQDVDVTLRFWDLDPTLPLADQEPVIGEELMVVNRQLTGLDLATGIAEFITVDLDPSEVFTADEALWAAASYSNAVFDGPGATSNVGQLLMNLPTCGMSANAFWFQNFGLAWFGPTGPVANFAWEIIRDISDVPGACCNPKVDGDDPAVACEDNVLAPDCDGVFHAFLTCDEVTCPTQVECPTLAPPCPWDINTDTVVNVIDLLILLENFGGCPPAPAVCTGDFNNDGQVNVIDLLILLENFGSCPRGDASDGEIIDENEPCGTRMNDGCSLLPEEDPVFAEISCGDTVCGTGWTAVVDETNTRDLDWYVFTVDDTERVVWSVHAEFPASAWIIWPTGSSECGELVVVDFATSPAKVPFSVEACLQPGTYYAVIAPSVFEGLPCEGEGQWGESYTAMLKCLGGEDCPVGPCCLNNANCIITSPEMCYLEGGAFNGHQETCEDVNCRDCSTGDLVFDDDDCDEETELDSTNGGCNVDPPAFTQVCCGDTVVGEVWAADGTRDLDWRIFSLKQPQIVNLSLTHDFGDSALDGVLWIVELPALSCDDVQFIDVQVGPSPVQLNNVALGAGTYIVIVSVASFNDLPCDSGNNGYSLTVSCSPFPCEGNCGNDFVPFGGGFCSCDLENCFEFGDCCPGVCDVCDPGGSNPLCQ